LELRLWLRLWLRLRLLVSGGWCFGSGPLLGRGGREDGAWEAFPRVRFEGVRDDRVVIASAGAGVHEDVPRHGFCWAFLVVEDWRLDWLSDVVLHTP